MLLLLLSCGPRTPLTDRIAEATVQESCQLCFFQRDGDLGQILKRLIWKVPASEVEFGHCFACIRCPGEDGLTDCRGFSPVDLEAAEYPPQPGRLYADHTDPWSRADCRPLLPGEAERLWSFALDYPDRHPYQVINRRGGRSCLGFCEDLADAAGMRTRARAGDLTLPGAMRFPDATFSLEEPAELTAIELTERLVDPAP